MHRAHGSISYVSECLPALNKKDITNAPYLLRVASGPLVDGFKMGNSIGNSLGIATQSGIMRQVICTWVCQQIMVR